MVFNLDPSERARRTVMSCRALATAASCWICLIMAALGSGLDVEGKSKLLIEFMAAG